MHWVLYIVVATTHPGAPPHPGVANVLGPNSQQIPGVAPSFGTAAQDTTYSFHYLTFASQQLAANAKQQILPLYGNHATAVIFNTE